MFSDKKFYSFSVHGEAIAGIRFFPGRRHTQELGRLHAEGFLQVFVDLAYIGAKVFFREGTNSLVRLRAAKPHVEVGDCFLSVTDLSVIKVAGRTSPAACTQKTALLFLECQKRIERKAGGHHAESGFFIDDFSI